MIINDPILWPRAYLAYMSTQVPSLVDAKFTDQNNLHAQLMGFREHGWHQIQAEIILQNEEVFKIMDNLDKFDTKWRKIICG